MMRRFLVSMALGIATSFLVGLAGTYLPYSTTRDAVTDALTLPGGLIASLVYSEGIHTGHGAPNWALLAGISNVIVYTLFWYAVLEIVSHIGVRRGTRDESGTVR